MKIYEINIPKLFYLYEGTIKRLDSKYLSSYHCPSCGHSFRSIWKTSGSFQGSRPADFEIYCPKCGTHYFELQQVKDFSFLNDGSYAPLNMHLQVDEYKDSLRLTLKGREIVDDTDSDYIFQYRNYKETISFNFVKRETVFKRYIAGKLTSNYILGIPTDIRFLEESNLRVLNHRMITMPYTADFIKMIKLLRDKIKKGLETKLKHSVSSLFYPREKRQSYFTTPLFNIAFRLIFTDLNHSLSGILAIKRARIYRLNGLDFYGITAAHFTKDNLLRLKKEPDTITGLIKIVNLPDKPLVRKILTKYPMRFVLLAKLYKIAHGDLDIFKNIYDWVENRKLLSVELDKDLNEFLQIADKWGIKYLNDFIRWSNREHNFSAGSDTLYMMSRLHEKAKLFIAKPKPTQLHDYLSIALYNQDHPFRKFDLSDPISRRLAMQLDSVKFYLPENSDVLQKVGLQMRNCVASYSERVYKGQTNIVLMTDDIGKLKVCIEVKNNEIVQAKLFGNKPVFTDEKLALEIKKWADKLNIAYKNCHDLKSVTSKQTQLQREAV